MNLFKVTDQFFKQQANGKFALQQWRKFVLPSWMYFDSSDVQGTYQVAAAGSPSRLVSFKQPYASNGGNDAGFGTPFEVKFLVFEDLTDGTANADFTVLLNELGETRQFMNYPVHVRTLAGTGKYPAKLREPYMMFSQHNIQAQFNKLSGNATDIRLYLTGSQYFPWAMTNPAEKDTVVGVLTKLKQRHKYLWPYWFTIDQPVTLSGNQTANFSVKVGDDAHFVIDAITCVSTGNFAYEINEPKTGRNISNGRATRDNSLGDAKLPTILPAPFVVPSGYTLRFTLEDLSGTTNNVFLTLSGRRVFAPLKDVPMLTCPNAVVRASA